MKAQTKALVASVVVIALALSAVSGITYSWWSDSESGNITINTGSLDVTTANHKVVLYDTSTETEKANLTSKATDLPNKVAFSYGGDEKGTIDLQEYKIDPDNMVLRITYDVTFTSTVDYQYKIAVAIPKNIGADVEILQGKEEQTLTTEEKDEGEVISFSKQAEANSSSKLDITYNVTITIRSVPQGVTGAELSFASTIAQKAATIVDDLSASAGKNATMIVQSTDNSQTPVTVNFSKVPKNAGSVTAQIKTNTNTATFTMALTQASGASDSPILNSQTSVTATLDGYYSNVLYKSTDDEDTGSQPTASFVYYNSAGAVMTDSSEYSTATKTKITFVTDHFSEFIAYGDAFPVATLDDLRMALKAGASEVQLTADLKDVNEDITVSSNTTLDLNGKTIAFTGTAGFVYSAAFTIVGTTGGSGITAEDGVILNTESNNGATLIVNGGNYVAKNVPLLYSGGKVTIENGTFEGNSILIASTGDITINGGTFETQGNKIGTEQDGYAEGLMNISSGKVTINGGTFTAKQNDVIYAAQEVNLEINGGSLKNESNKGSVIFIYSGTVTIRDGTFEGGAYPISIQTVGDTAGELTIYGGTFKMNAGNNTSKTLIDIGSGSKAEVGLNGGNFEITATGSGYAYFFYQGTDASVAVTGGTYTLTENEGSSVVCQVANVASGGNPEIISGGTFNVNPSGFLVSGYAVEETTGTGTTTYEVVKSEGA